MRSHITIGLALVSSISMHAQAQNTPPTEKNLPNAGEAPGETSKITAVGDQLQWNTERPTFTLKVAERGLVALNIYSPHTVGSDYRSKDYYGDEQYNKKPTLTTFTLTDSDGDVVRSITYREGHKHTWENFLSEYLDAGEYTLTVDVKGNSKNTFQLQLVSQIQASLNAKNTIVNVKGNDHTTALEFTIEDPSTRSVILKNYDGDGKGELEGHVLLPNGTTMPLPISGDKSWAALEIPALKGHYKVLLRQPKGAKQHSNSLTFQLIGRQMTLSQSAGKLNLKSRLSLPGKTEKEKVQTNVKLNGVDLHVPEDLSLNLPQGDYRLEPAQMEGTTVTAPGTLHVQPDASTTAEVVYRPEVKLTLDAPTTVKVGEEFTVTITAHTDFARDLIVTQKLISGVNFKLSTPNKSTGVVRKGRTYTTEIKMTATQTGTFTLLALEDVFDQSHTLKVEVQAN